jgi:LEA14-like dessication related protein
MEEPGEPRRSPVPSLLHSVEEIMRKLTLALALAASAVGIGCASGGSGSSTPRPPFYRPEVALRNVRFAGAGITGGSMDVVLHVYNPNDYQLRSPRVAYRLMVDRHELAHGVYDLDVTVPPGDSATLLVPVKVGYTSVARSARSLLDDGTVNYRVVGKIHVDTPYGRLAAPYDRNGRFAPITAAISHGTR